MNQAEAKALLEKARESIRGAVVLLDAYDLREAGDYEIREVVPEEAAKTLIEQAKEFLGAAEKYL